MAFNRPPRIQTLPPQDELELPAPANVPSKPSATSWLYLGIPLAVMLLTVVVWVSLAGQGGSALGFLLFIPMMLATFLVTIITNEVQKRQYQQKLAQAKKDFQATLDKVKTKLTDLQQRQKEALFDVNPDLNNCLKRVESKSYRVGERRPRDPDFLSPRLGLGRVKSSYSLKLVDPKAFPEGFEAELESVKSLYTKHLEVDDMPIPARLTETGSIGVAGARPEVAGVIRAVLIHLLTHHWPSELKVGVIGPSLKEDWNWLQPLSAFAVEFINARPKSTNLQKSNDLLNWVMNSLEAELRRRVQIVEANKTLHNTGEAALLPLPAIVLIFDHLPADYSHPALSLLTDKGRDLGVVGIFLVPKVNDVPSGCGATIEIQKGTFIYQETGILGRKNRGKADTWEVREAEEFSKRLKGLDWALDEDGSQPPDKVSFLEDLFGVSTVEELPLETWWDTGSPTGYLKVNIGRTSKASHLVFNLNEADEAHGPHGVIGGKTGSGKSEVIKTIVLALALTHHPYDLNFALIDYKGGTAFNELKQLPHTVGVITNIDENASYASRVILALAGEMAERERLLAWAKDTFGLPRAHIDDYRKLTVRYPLPRLVIIFDEFAEFKQRHPEESKRLISIARKGRALGIHLVLATQDIMSAVDDEILQNSTFRICLRVADVQASTRMIGIPDAITLSKGRAFFQSPSGRQLVQIGFSGQSYLSHSATQAPKSGWTRLYPDGHRETIVLSAAATESGNRPTEPEPTESEQVIKRLLQTNMSLGLGRLRRVWPDPLPSRLYLPKLIKDNVAGYWTDQQRTWGECKLLAKNVVGQAVHPILGLYDHPAKQEQFIFQLDPSQGGGHLLIFGSAGSGKSTLLRTILVSLALTRSPDDVHMYGIDFGVTSALSILQGLPSDPIASSEVETPRGLPHIGSIINRYDSERIERLLQFIHTVMRERNELFTRTGKSYSWYQFNENMRASRLPTLPAIFLVIDGLGDFRRTFPDLMANVSALIGGGQAAGVFLIITASRRGDVPDDLFEKIGLRLTFNQADDKEYFGIVGQISQTKMEEVKERPLLPGRGFIPGATALEFQAALPVEGTTEQAQTDNLNLLVEQMRQSGSKTAQEIRRLEALVDLPFAGQIDEPSLTVSLGKDYATLDYVELRLRQDGPIFMILGAYSRSGKTTLLQSWVIGLAEKYRADQIRFVFIDSHGSRSLKAFHKLPHTEFYIKDESQLSATLNYLTSEVAKRKAAIRSAFDVDPDNFDNQKLVETWPQIVVVIDDFPVFASGYKDVLLDDSSANLQKNMNDWIGSIAKDSEKIGFNFILASSAAQFPNGFDSTLAKLASEQGCGVLLGGISGLDKFNDAKPPFYQAKPASLPVGRGYLVRQGQVQLIQSVVFWAKDETPDQALKRRVEAIRGSSLYP